MSGYKPQRGDTVEVILRGEVLHVYGTGAISVADHQKATRESVVVVGERHVVSVEKVEPPKPPLPTTPGSVIRSTLSGAHALLLRRGRWINGAGYEWAPGNDGEAWEIIYDAGAES